MAYGLHELVGGAGQLWLEESEPEDLRVDALGEDLANLSLQIGVDNILHVNGVEIVGPRMQHLEALMLDLLFPVSFNVTFEEVKRRLVRLDGVAQIIFDNWLVLPQERADRLDARRTLQILRIDELLNVLVELDGGGQSLQLHGLQEPIEHRPIAFKVPVLINDLVNDSCLEDLVRLVGEQVDQVVHVIDGLWVLHVLSAPLRKNLLAEGGHEVLEVRIAGQLAVLPRELHTHFDLVAERSE